MNELVKKLKKNKVRNIFTLEEAKSLKLKDNSFDFLLDEAIKNEWIDNIYKNIYTLRWKECNTPSVSLYYLAQVFDPDCYVSTMFVLSDYDWIPEYGCNVSCITTGEEKIIDTNKYGRFIYRKLYDRYISAGIYEKREGNQKYRMAKPLRALCDLIYQRNEKIEYIGSVYDALRLEWEYLEALKKKDINELKGKFGIDIIEYFLEDLERRIKL